MAVLLALVSALAYGLSDFVGGVVSRRAPAWSVAVVAQVSSAVCTAAAALAVRGTAAPADFAWATLGGVAAGAGTGFLYRGFATGRMSVVAPVSAVGAAVVPLVVGTVVGERPGAVAWLGILAALPGIWLVAGVPEDDLARLEPGRRSTFAEGLVDGALAGAGFGVLFVALGQIPDSAGLWPLTVAQVAAVPVIVLLAMALRAPWTPRGRFVRWALLAGPLAALAATCFLLATSRGYLTISGVLASLYPATTVLLAATVLKERVHRAQGVGLGLCALAVVLVALG